MYLGRRPGILDERSNGPCLRTESPLAYGSDRSTDTEARWREEAATSCWEPPSAGSVPLRARRRGGVAPRSDARRCCRHTTARPRASCIRRRRGDRRSRGRRPDPRSAAAPSGTRVSTERIEPGGTDARQHGQAEAPGRDRAQACRSGRAAGRPRRQEEGSRGRHHRARSADRPRRAERVPRPRARGRRRGREEAQASEPKPAASRTPRAEARGVGGFGARRGRPRPEVRPASRRCTRSWKRRGPDAVRRVLMSFGSN